MTSRQVAKYWKYRKYDYISGFPTLKLSGMQIFEFLTRTHRKKLNFDRFYPSFVILSYFPWSGLYLKSLNPWAFCGVCQKSMFFV